MRHPKIILGAVGLAAVAAVAGVATATAGGSSASRAPATQQATAAPVHTTSANVGGLSETILVDGNGMPLYYYQPDTATSSMVTGRLAALWPPLTATTPTLSLANGQLTSVADVHGSQVAYNGHPLYTFVSDHPGTVTGQGVENFFVATPGLAPLAGASGIVPSTPPASSASGYSGY